MGSSRNRAHERAAQITAMRAEAERRERRRRWITYGSAAIVCLGLIVAVGIPLSGQLREQRAREAAIKEAARTPISGVEELPAPSASHVDQPVDYPMSPPAGGDHAQVWQNCGVYREPVADENAVHSLEHGAVWIAYSADLSRDDVAVLEGYAEGQGFVLVSPYDGLESPIVLTAWGIRLPVEDAADKRIAPFLAKYVKGAQTPEPGAACSGGVGSPVA